MAERFPSWKQALVTCFGGLVLAGTSCFGFFLTLSGNFEHGGNDVLTPLTAIGFGIGMVALGVGFVFVLMRLLRALMDKKPTPPTTPPAGPPAGSQDVV
jgi:hypothetical protein